MSADTSTAALLAWCKREAAYYRQVPQEHSYVASATRWEALAAIVRAHETLEAEIEKLAPIDTWELAAKVAYDCAIGDVLRLLAARGAQR